MSSIYYKNQKYTGPTLDLGSGSLTTENKTIVGAINELDARVDALLTHSEYTTSASDSEYVIAGAKLIKSGAVCSIQFNGLKDVPNGGWTTLLTLPTAFATTTQQIIDLIANATDATTTTQIMRFLINGNLLKIYNYGSLFNNRNWKHSITYFI